MLQQLLKPAPASFVLPCLPVPVQKRAALMSRLASSAGIVQPGAVPGAAPYAVPGLTSAAGASILPGGLLVPGAVPGLLPGAVPGALADLSLQQGLLGPASPIPTQCLLLKNMFDASAQTEPEWEKEVAEDVRDECSKFGAVLHLHVDKASQVREEGGLWMGLVSRQGAKGVMGGWVVRGQDR